MCGRYVLKQMPAKLKEHFDLDEVADFGPHYNIPPGTDIPVIRQSPEGKWVLHLLRWGLVPHWVKDPSIGNKLNNARGETVAEKPSFRDAFKRRRCIIPADGFYEWKTEGRVKQPYYISLKSGEPLAMGGIWESWRRPDGEILRTACIITTGPNEVMTPIHDRMPVILRPEDWQAWLNAPADEVQGMVGPYDAEPMQAWPVSRRVSKTVDDDAGLIEPASSPIES
ncbi:SOS response-associated peptidase [Thiobacillus denitrificans]|uniref:SOS response-associated peptidase n=1 Tax=Thiobacillus denitrificans TaxID=36861 RepID=UPI000380520E|nr:SOS response-associated peptidase [Thiobacillus denitrificans]